MQAIAIEHEMLVKNLRTAFDHESNAHLRYVEFAEKADGEGWHGIASLFRAVSCAEQIHAANHARILHQLGGHAEYTPQAIEVNATFENLRTALAGEIFEADTMYPAFAELARAARGKTVCHNLHGVNPISTLRDHLQRPVLAFYGIEVASA